MDERLGCFHAFVIVNTAVINMEVQIPVQDADLTLGYMLRGGIAGSYGSSIFTFVSVFSIVVAPVCNPTNSATDFSFLNILPSLVILMIAIITDVS